MLVGGLSQKKCEQYYKEAAKTTYDIVIVPGIPYNGIKWDSIMKGRVYWAKHLYDNNITKRIMFSGGAVYSKFYEAKIMALYAKKLGIPDSAIYVETKAEHTVENVYYSYQKAKNLGFNNIALASDPFQCKAMRNFIQNNFDSMALIPFVIRILGDGYKPDVQIEDSAAVKPDFVSLNKRESFFKRRKGTKGRNINEGYYKNGKLD